jgi:hypothetical protein
MKNKIEKIASKYEGVWRLGTQELFNEQLEQTKRDDEWDESHKDIGGMVGRLPLKQYFKKIKIIEDKYNKWYRITDFKNNVIDINSNSVFSITYGK